jgi:uncharacterized Zn-binding protein involved in type VI secretion
MNVRRSMLALVVAIGAVLIAASPAFADFGSDPDEPFVVLTGALVVPNASAVSDAIIFNGDATILGDVDGQVIAFNGDITVSGNVTDNVVSFNGHVTLLAGAHVGGDIASRFIPQIAPTATVDGQLRSARRLDVNFGKLTAVSRIFIWLATTVSSFLLGLLLVLFVPRAAEAVAQTAAGRLGASIGFGFLMLLGIPIAAVLAIGVLLGIPLGVGVLLALGLLYWLGYTAGAYALGRRLISGPGKSMLAFLAGWGILRGLALIPVLASLVWLAATVWGLGALVIAARTAGRPTADAAGAGVVVSGTPPPPVPPPPPVVTG